MNKHKMKKTVMKSACVACVAPSTFLFSRRTCAQFYRFYADGLQHDPGFLDFTRIVGGLCFLGHIKFSLDEHDPRPWDRRLTGSGATYVLSDEEAARKEQDGSKLMASAFAGMGMTKEDAIELMATVDAQQNQGSMLDEDQGKPRWTLSPFLYPLFCCPLERGCVVFGEIVDLCRGAMNQLQMRANADTECACVGMCACVRVCVCFFGVCVPAGMVLPMQLLAPRPVA